MTTLTLRLATAEDIPALLKCMASVGQNWSEAAVLDYLKDQYCTVVIAVDGGEVIHFWFERQDHKANVTTCGPIGGPSKDPDTWWKLSIECALCSVETTDKRFPKFDYSTMEVQISVWPVANPGVLTAVQSMSTAKRIEAKGSASGLVWHRPQMIADAKARLGELTARLGR